MREGILVNLFMPLLGVVILPYSILKRNINFIYGWIIGFGLILGLSFGVEPGGTSDVIKGFSTYQSIQDEFPSLTYIFTNLYQHHLLFDIFQPLVLWGFSSINASYNLYLGFVGLLYSVFLVILSKLYFRYNIGKPSYWQLFLLGLVLCVVPQWHAVNNIRFFLAVVVFTTGVFSNRSGYSFLALTAASLIHFSLVWLTSLWLILGLIKPRYNIRFGLVLFVTTLFASIDALSIADIVSKYVPDFAYDRVDSYTEESYVKEKLENRSSIDGKRSLAGNIIDYGIPAILLSMVLLIYRNRYTVFDVHRELFQRIVLVGSIINILSTLPSFGRFHYVTLLVFIGILMQVDYARIKSSQLSFYLSVLFIIIAVLYGVVKIRLLFYFLTVEFSFGLFNLFIGSDLFDKLLISELF